MLRGLIIRKLFVLVDLSLLVLLLCVGWLVFSKVMRERPADGAGVVGAASADTVVNVASVQDRPIYDVIFKNGLFGKAATTVVAEEKEDPVKPDAPDEIDTTLPLKLLGTTATYPTDPLATAMIKNTQRNTEYTYYLNQPVVDNVILLEVHKKQVVLLNKNNQNRREILSMDDEKGANPPGAAAVSAAVANPVKSVVSQSSQVNLNRQQVMDEFSQDYASIVQTLNPEMYKDSSGKTLGITSQSFSKVPLAQTMGLQDGDVVTQINGVDIDSEQKMFEIVQKFEKLNVHRVAILRNGQKQMVTYKFE